MKFENNNDEIVYTLIKTHGLVGQYIKGEVNLNKNIELYYLHLQIVENLNVNRFNYNFYTFVLTTH